MVKNTSSKLSIITVTRNSERFLEETITSVGEQTYKNIEYIIIDGGSTDSTLDIIKKHEDTIDKWISERDDGIADAMNKGLDLATGEYILFLHSDDYLLEPSVLESAVQDLIPPWDIIMYNIVFEYDGKKTIHSPRGINWWLNFKTGVFHQSVICSRNLFKQIGHFDTQFKIAMDYDFFLRTYKKNVTVLRRNMPLSLMRLTGISSQRDWPSLKKRFHEERCVHNKHCSNLLMAMLYRVYWPTYLSYRKSRIKSSFTVSEPQL